MKTKEVNGRNGMLQSIGILCNEIWNGTSFYCSLCIVFCTVFLNCRKTIDSNHERSLNDIKVKDLLFSLIYPILQF